MGVGEELRGRIDDENSVGSEVVMAIAKVGIKIVDHVKGLETWHIGTEGAK